MTFVTNPYIFLASSNTSKEQKIVRVIVRGSPEAGAVIRVRLGTQVFTTTVPANSSNSSIADALAFAINADARYEAISEGETLIVTGPPHYDYPVEILTTATVVPAKVALTGYTNQIGSNFQTDISRGIATLVIDGVKYESKAVAGDTITTAGKRLADMITAGLIDFEETPSLSEMRQIPGRDPFAFERYIRTSDGVSISRILRSADNGQTWAGTQIIEGYIPEWQAEFGGKKIAILSGPTTAPNQVFTQQGEGTIVATNRSLKLPQSAKGNFIYTRGHYFSEGVFYMVGREQDPTLGTTSEIHLYSTTNGLDLIDLGRMVRDPTDTYGKDDNIGGMGAYSYDLMQGSSNIGDGLRTLTRNNGRWFLTSAHAVYWTDEIVPTTGWRRANMTVTTDAFNEGLGPLFAYGNILLIPLKGIPGPAQYAVSFNNGTSWATEAIVYIEAGLGQSKSEINFFQYVNGLIVAYHQGTGVMPTNEVFVSSAAQPLVWSSRPLKGVAHVADVPPLTQTPYGVAFVERRYDETTILLSPDGYEFRKAQVSRFIEANPPQQLNAYVDFENVIVQGINTTPQATGSSTGSTTYVTYVNEADWVPILERKDPAKTFFPAFARADGRVLGVYYGPNPLATQKLYISYDRGRNFTPIAGTPAKITQRITHRAIRDDDTFVSLQAEDLTSTTPKDVNVVRGLFGIQPVALQARFSHLKSPVCVGTDGVSFYVVAEPRNLHRSDDGANWEDLGTMDTPTDFSHQISTLPGGEQVYANTWGNSRLHFIRGRWFFGHDKLYYNDNAVPRTGWLPVITPAARSAPIGGDIIDINGVLYTAFSVRLAAGDNAPAQTRLHRSYDLGRTWQETATQRPHATFKDVLLLGTDVLVGLALDADRSVDRSFDGGDSWLQNTTNIALLGPGYNESAGGTMYVRGLRNQFSEVETNDILYSDDGVNFAVSKAPDLGVPGGVIIVNFGPTGVEKKTPVRSVHYSGDTVAVMFQSGSSSTLLLYRYTGTDLIGYAGFGAANSIPVRALSEGDITYAIFASTTGATRLSRLDRVTAPYVPTHAIDSPSQAGWRDFAISSNALWLASTNQTQLVKVSKTDLTTLGAIDVNARAVGSDGPNVYALTPTQLVCYNEAGEFQYAFDVPYGEAPDRRVTIDAGRAFIEGDYTLVYLLSSRQLIATLPNGRVSIGGDEIVIGLKVYDRTTLASLGALSGTRPINAVAAMGNRKMFVALPAVGGDSVDTVQIWGQLA